MNKLNPSNYHFHVNAENDIREVVFQIDHDNFSSSCNCGYNSDHKLCWHRYYVLAGKTQRLPDEELKLQQELIRQLSQVKGGEHVLNVAKHNFGEKETCRRCNSTHILELNKSLYGQIIKLFLKKNRKYFCRTCRWSW